MPDNISRNAQDLIRRILVVDPNKRLSVSKKHVRLLWCIHPIHFSLYPFLDEANHGTSLVP